MDRGRQEGLCRWHHFVGSLDRDVFCAGWIMQTFCREATTENPAASMRKMPDDSEIAPQAALAACKKEDLRFLKRTLRQDTKERGSLEKLTSWAPKKSSKGRFRIVLAEKQPFFIRPKRSIFSLSVPQLVTPVYPHAAFCV
jgi:hypothetical protein